jgi:hypothetical protein
METSFGQFVLNLTDETNEALSIFYLAKMFLKKSLDLTNKYFLSVWLHPDILKAKSDNRNFAEGL